MKTLKNVSAGFSLVEVMVVVAIMSVVALGVASLMNNIVTTTSTQKYSTETNDLHEELRAALSDTTACLNTFNGIDTGTLVGTDPTNGIDLPLIKGATNDYPLGQQDSLHRWYGDGSINLTNIHVNGYVDTSAPYGLILVSLTYTHVNVVQGSQVLLRTIRVQTQKDITNKINGCVALAKMSDGIWQYTPNAANTQWDPFFVGGDVGIGTATPQVPLDVATGPGAGGLLSSIVIQASGGAGSIGLRSQAAGSNYIDLYDSAAAVGSKFMRLGNEGNGLSFQPVNDAYTSAATAMIITPSGFVGIGNTTPTVSLMVNGASRAAKGVPSAGDVSNVGFAFSQDGDTGMFAVPDPGYAYSEIDGSDIAFLNDSVEMLRLAKGGVGIGTQLPAAAFDVESTTATNIAMFGSTNPSGTWIGVNNAGGGGTWSMVSTGTGNGEGPGKFLFKSAATTKVVETLDPAGYVGINNVSPAFPMDIKAQNSGSPALAWGDTNGTSSILNADQGGSIELGSAIGGAAGMTNPVTGGTPYIDFHYGTGTAEDYNMRVINNSNGVLAVSGMFGAAQQEIARFVFQGGSSYYLGVGTATPAYQLDVNGDINFTNRIMFGGITKMCDYSGCTASPSDIRLKENIHPLTKSLEKVNKLQGVSYDWKNKVRYGNDPQIGFIAQEVEKIFPQVVQTDAKTGQKSMMYDRLVAPVVEAIKALYEKVMGIQKEVDELKAENQKLKQENAAILERLKALEQKVEQK